MSDAPQGPDWWQASDDKWYPPPRPQMPGDAPAAESALARVGMTEHMNRAIRGYSKGMRQRTKIAQALVHGPRVLFLDEPLSGTDPVARRDLVDVIRGLGAAGCTVLVSSHVLDEVQVLTPNIVLLHRGRLVAEGHVRDIRDLIDQHPHRIVLVGDKPRALAARLAGCDDVVGIQFLSLGLLSELVTSQHRERSRTGDERPSRLVDEILR